MSTTATDQLAKPDGSQAAVAYGIPGVMPQTPDAVWIISIFPFVRRHELQLGRFITDDNGNARPVAGFRKFELPPATRSQYRILKVEGGLKYLPNYAEVGEGNEAPGMEPVWQSADIVARSLVEYWTKHTFGVRGKPAIEVLRYEDMRKDENGQVVLDNHGNPIPTGSIATKTGCLGRMTKDQEIYAESRVQNANDLHLQGRTKEITGLDRGMAQWLYGTGANKLDWFPKQEFRELKECPKCGAEVLSHVLGCKECGIDFPDYYLKMHIDPSTDPPVAAAIKRIQEAQTSNAAPGDPLASEIAEIESIPPNARTKAQRQKLIDYRSRKR